MEEGINVIKELLDKEKCNSMQNFLSRLNIYFAEKDNKQPQVLTSELISKEFIEEIKNIPKNISVSFGKTLRDIKCTLMDEDGLREHEIFLRYKSNNKLSITNVQLPYSSYQDGDYSSISEVVTVYQNYIKSLSAYFQEMDNIDQNCTVVEPVEPTYKDDYRRILLGLGFLLLEFYYRLNTWCLSTRDVLYCYGAAIEHWSICHKM